MYICIYVYMVIWKSVCVYIYMNFLHVCICVHMYICKCAYCVLSDVNRYDTAVLSGYVLYSKFFPQQKSQARNTINTVYSVLYQTNS